MRGRPRNYELEVKILDLIVKGWAVGRVAAHLCIHRNTVGNIKKRARSICAEHESAQEQQQYELALVELHREWEKIEAKRKQLESELQAVRFKQAIKQLISLIETAAEAIAEGRSVWASLSLDKPLGKEGNCTLYTFVAAESNNPAAKAESEELADLLAGAMSSLSDLQSKILKAIFWDQKEPAAIANELGITADEVAAAQRGALDVLREQVAA